MKKPILSVRSLVTSHANNRMPRRKGKQVTINVAEDPIADLTLRAIDDLYTFIGHVRALTLCPLSKRIGLYECFDSLESVLNEILQSISAGREVGSWGYVEDLEIQSLEEVLDNMWSPDNAVNYGLDDENETVILLLNLIQFWVKEIRDRGYAIQGLLVGSECFETVGRSLEHLKSVNYPPVYGECE